MSEEKDLTVKYEAELDKVNSHDDDSLMPDEKILRIYSKILDESDEDRSELSEIIDNFKDLVVNNGDASSSSKEALVNLLKIKTDITDKKIKIADLMTRIKLKEKNTMPDWQKSKANQASNTTVNIIDFPGNRRALLDEIRKSNDEK